AAGEERNKTLLASLRWSTGRLSEETRRMLPYLAWFEGGAFEVVLERFCAVGPRVWGRVREELLATALVRGDDEVLLSDKPFLVLHPTLPYAAEPDDVADKTDAQKQFVRVYYGIGAAVHNALQGTDPASPLCAMVLEERNIKRAAMYAVEQGD